jgi:hypothetical protein
MFMYWIFILEHSMQSGYVWMFILERSVRYEYSFINTHTKCLGRTFISEHSNQNSLRVPEHCNGGGVQISWKKWIK